MADPGLNIRVDLASALKKWQLTTLARMRCIFNFENSANLPSIIIILTGFWRICITCDQVKQKVWNIKIWKATTFLLVCYTAVFSVVTQRSSPGGALCDDSKNGCVADYFLMLLFIYYYVVWFLHYVLWLLQLPPHCILSVNSILARCVVLWNIPIHNEDFHAIGEINTDRKRKVPCTVSVRFTRL